MTEVNETPDVSVRMRDGVTLRTDIYRPRTQAPLPTLLMRTPYDKQRSDYGREAFRPVARAAAEAGYAVAVQDIRGRFASEGDFQPFYCPPTLDGADGHDTIEWLAAQPWSSGRVGTFGDSYGAWAQWELAREQPPHLKAMFPSGLGLHALDFPILRVGRRILWLIGRMAPDSRRRLAIDGPVTADEAYDIWNSNERGKWYWFLPWSQLPDSALGGLGGSFRDFIDRAPFDYLTHDWNPSDVTVPVLQLTGWFDIDPAGTIDRFCELQDRAGSGYARTNQRLIIGPWTHMDPFYDLPSRLGALDFGSQSERSYIDILSTWCGEWLVDSEVAPVTTAPVSFFIMGRNEWASASSWPPDNTRERVMFLSSTQGANGRSGDGVLLDTPAADPGGDAYVYDPRDPVMSTYLTDSYAAPLDQRPIDFRDDVLIYRTQPLTDHLTVVGSATVNLWATSSAVDTDFAVKLVDERPDGEAIAITSGIVRARFRDGVGDARLLTPGELVEYHISLQPTAYSFVRGSILRLQVTSSDFPDYDRNHNSGLNDLTDPTLVPAHQRVLHGGSHPSNLIVRTLP